MSEVIEPETVTERVAVVVMELANGEEMTTREIAEMTGLTYFGAWRLMNRLCRVPKLSLTYSSGRWSSILTARQRGAATLR